MAPDVRTFTLNTGDEMLAVGFGTWNIPRYQAAKAVETALRAGYRHIDTAPAYGNEREVGAGICASGVPGEEIWISGKLRNNWHKHASQDADNPTVCYKDWDFVDTWIEMEELLHEGKVMNIGVSNFGIQQLETLLNDPWTEIVPAVDQIELHPCNPSPKLVAYCTSQDIHTEGYSCLGSGRSALYRNKTLVDIADAKEKTVHQVLLQRGIEKGWGVVCKSVTPSRIESNLELGGWELTNSSVR
ncbi:unnamed protein product [Fusarium langsethiae]|nr:unnamed protein product [Fusarium langsethiae]